MRYQNDVNDVLLVFLPSTWRLCFLETEAVALRCSVKKVFLKFHKFHRKISVPESFLIKLQAEATSGSCFYGKLFKRLNRINYRGILVKVFAMSQMLFKIGVLQNFAKFTENACARASFL